MCVDGGTIIVVEEPLQWIDPCALVSIVDDGADSHPRRSIRAPRLPIGSTRKKT
jgi:hypothetical protein